MAAATKVLINMRVPWRSGLVVPTVFAGFTALFAQSVLGAPTFAHEFTALLSIVMGLVFYAVSGKVLRGMYASQADEDMGAVLQRSLFLLILGAGASAVVAIAIMYGFNEFIHGCFFGRGMPYFWLTWTPIVLFAMVLGLWTAARGWGWIRRLLLLVAFILALFAHDWTQMELGLRPINPLLGLDLFLDQRAGIEVPRIHIYHRIGVLLVTASLWWTCLWWQGDAGALTRRWVTLSWALTAIYVAGAGSYAGLGFGNGKIHATLPETRESEHFVFHYAPHGDGAANIERTVRFAEWNWARLTGLMEVTPSRKVTIHLAENHDMTWELSGKRTASAGPWRMTIDDDSVRTDTFLHELVHALDIGDARSEGMGLGPWTARWKLLKQIPALLVCRGATEGIAEAYSDEFATTKFAHRQQAAALIEDKLPPARDFMGLDGFRKMNESNAYNLSGSFMGFLVQTHGIGAINRFLDDRLDYVGAFGKDIDALDADWREFLREIPVTTREVLAMGHSFDTSLSKGFTEECCPKLGQRTPELETLAYDAYRRGSYPEALAAYEQLYAETGEERHLVQQIKIHEAMGARNEALAQLDLLLGEADQSPARCLEYSRLRLTYLVGARDWDGVYELVTRWSEIEPDVTEDILRTHRLLRVPAYQERMAQLMTADDDYERRRAIESLADEFPDDEDIAYLYQVHIYARMWPRWNHVDISPENRTKLAQLLPYIASRPDVADRLGDRLEQFAGRALHAGDFALAAEIVDTLERHAEDPMRLHRMAVMKARIAFEKDYAARE